MKAQNYKNLRAPEEYILRRYDEKIPTFPYRTEFDRDRDRILFSKAFRRLKGKTQVFLSSGDDYLRTRLTHTLEVVQISRIIAYNLHLNGILTEAIATGHDLGHTPFGHIGERTLNLIMNGCDKLGEFQSEMNETDKGFKHNWQGIRVVCELEKLYGREGLNLTNFTLWGICNHSKITWSNCSYFIDNPDPKKRCYLLRNPDKCNHDNQGSIEIKFYEKYSSYLNTIDNHPTWSFEGYIVAIADEIAQRHHDMEDAIIAGVVDKEELLTIINSCFKQFYSKNFKNDVINRTIINQLRKANNSHEFLPYLSKFILNFYTNQIITTSKDNLAEFIRQNNLNKRIDFITYYPEIKETQVSKLISYNDEFQDKDRELQGIIRNRILNSSKAQQMDGKGRFVIRRLFKAYITNPRQLYDSTILAVFKIIDKDFSDKKEYDKQLIGNLRNQIDASKNKSDPRFQIALLRAICDNISGMTDDFALNQYKLLYG